MMQCSKLLLIVATVHTYVSFHDNARCHHMAGAFVVKSWYRTNRCHSTSTALYEIQMSRPFPESDVTLDHDRAQYCVDHFGSCSIAEMESLKNGMHFCVVVMYIVA